MSTEDTQGRSGLTPGLIVGAVFLVVVLVVGAVLTTIFLTRDDGSDGVATAAPPTPAATSSTEAVETDSVCGLDGYATSGQALAAPEVTWEHIGVYGIPVSSEHGPGAVSPDGFYYCYSRTPEGAALAAIAIALEESALSTEQYEAWRTYIFTSDAPAEDMTDTRSTIDTTARVDVEGYRIISYDGTTALVDVAATVAYGSQILGARSAYLLEWESGDWKLRPMAEQSEGAAVDSFAGYVLLSELDG